MAAPPLEEGLYLLAFVLFVFVGIVGFLASGELTSAPPREAPAVTSPRVVPHWSGGPSYSHTGG